MSLSIEPLRPVRTHFENSAHYQISGDEEEWDRLIPGDGTVRIGPPSRDTQEYTLSIYHQLRCLNLIRKNIIEVEHRQLHEPDFNAIMSSTQHCINYLRKMVLCRSDLDLESRDHSRATESRHYIESVPVLGLGGRLHSGEGKSRQILRFIRTAQMT